MRDVCAKCGEPCNAVVKTETRLIKGQSWRKETLKCSACRFVDYEWDLLFPAEVVAEAQIEDAAGLVEEELLQPSARFAVSGRAQNEVRRQRVSQKIRPYMG